MIYFDPRFEDYDLVVKIRKKAIDALAAGVIITSWTAEGTSFSGRTAGNTEEILAATTRYFDEYEGNLVTETLPNFRV